MNDCGCSQKDPSLPNTKPCYCWVKTLAFCLAVGAVAWFWIWPKFVKG